MSQRATTLKLVLLMSIGFLLAGCEAAGGLVETFGETLHLQKAIYETYGNDGDLSVQYSIELGIGKSIKITWENSENFSPSSPNAREQAKELAQFAYDNYLGIDDIEHIQIIFITSRQVLVVNSTKHASFLFDKSEFSDGDS